MRKNRILLIGATILLLIVVYIIFSKYREPLSNDSRKELIQYFILSPSSTPSPLTDDQRIKYVNAIGVNDSKYKNVLKSDLTNPVKVEKIKELLAEESD
jgi:hypothetical protein